MLSFEVRPTFPTPRYPGSEGARNPEKPRETQSAESFFFFELLKKWPTMLFFFVRFRGPNVGCFSDSNVNGLTRPPPPAGLEISKGSLPTLGFRVDFGRWVGFQNT